MRRHVMLFVVAALRLVGRFAHAWDGPELWYASTSAPNPGGGGIFGTGSARDYGITCKDCHIEPAVMDTIGFNLQFTPALGVGGSYQPGQMYSVQAVLQGEKVGMSGCAQYMAHVNNFAARFEKGDGSTAGVLASDSGQSATACPQTCPTAQAAGTTGLCVDCEVIFSKGAENRTTWTFSWTAPPAGSGPITVFWGAVDSDCTMMSMGDVVAVGKTDLVEAMAAAPPPSRTRPYGFAFLALALPMLWWRRGRHSALLVLLLFSSCSDDPKEAGSLGGACLPGGTCLAGLVCESGTCVSGNPADAGGQPEIDGGASPTVDAAPFDGAGAAPTAMINHPGDGDMRTAGVPIEFIGVGSDAEDGSLTGASLVWTSNIDGQIGTGETFFAPLTVGVHTVTLTVTDSDGNTGTASVTQNVM